MSYDKKHRVIALPTAWSSNKMVKGQGCCLSCLPNSWIILISVNKSQIYSHSQWTGYQAQKFITCTCFNQLFS